MTDAGRAGFPLGLDGLAYGGDYNPDQWPEEVWEVDADLMLRAGVNLVTLPVFSWPLLEIGPGSFDFDWLDRVIDVLWSRGIRIDLATASATPPAWLVRAHPEVLPVTADGVRLEFGSRQSYCPSSPVFRDHVVRLTETMAQRYGSHPALAMWHVSNEYGDHVSRCWCPASAAHFRRWLQARYRDLDGLNRAWGTSAWGQHYTDWSQIEAPRRATGPINPAQLTDFERFSSDALLELFTAEVGVLRRVTPSIPVTTNFMSLFTGLDYWDFAAAEDLVTDDAYPDPADPRAHVGAALNYGLMRSLKDGAPWLLLEQAPSAVSWRDVNVPKAPGQMRAQSLQAIAHGSDGAMFFQWRAARFGPEKYHSAMLGHRGTESRSFVETSALGAELRSLAGVRGARVRSEVALVVDWDSLWGLAAPDSLPSLRLDWTAQARAWHAALHAFGPAVDTVRATGPFEGYAAVVVPNLYATTPEQAAALTAYVERGGTLVVGPFSGVVDACEQVHDGGAPGPLRDVLGVEVDEWWPIPDGQSVAVSLTSGPTTAQLWSEWLVPTPGTEVVGTYLTGDLARRPAVTQRRHGDGTAWYVGAGLVAPGLREVLGRAVTAAGVQLAARPSEDVEVVTRTDGQTDHTFVINHGRATASVTAPPGAVVVTGGALESGRVTLDPFGAVVLRHPTTPAPPAPGILDSLTTGDQR